MDVLGGGGCAGCNGGGGGNGDRGFGGTEAVVVWSGMRMVLRKNRVYIFRIMGHELVCERGEN